MKIPNLKPALPDIVFPEELPITAQCADIMAAIRDHPVVIVAGETGSGKTTQLPKMCLALGRGREQLIGHTQPRRIAAHAVASRIAEELRSELGDYIGYQVRFQERLRSSCYVKVMTDGILLAEIERDRWLSAYDTLIIDEAHERSLNIDFLLGYLHRLLPKRPDLKLIITSATIELTRFAKHFSNAPIFEVSGRMYPVETRYQALDEDMDLYEAIYTAVQALQRESPGDMLVFLSGEREIRELADIFRKQPLSHTEILPLYARLSHNEQQKIFASHRGHRIVLTTNIAETSLTVPGIRYVIDSGFARISRYSHRSKVQRLPIEPISQASAKQRAGRCGRIASGICVRLYSEQDFATRPAFTEPEILRTNLASVILRMKQCKLGDIEQFPFLDPPDIRLIRDGKKLLFELEALDDQETLTSLGEKLAGLPTDPRLARMIVAASQMGCLREVIVIASGLCIQDPREWPMEQTQAAQTQHSHYAVDHSDFIGLWRLWQYCEQHHKERSHRKWRAFCHEHFLSATRIAEWQDIVRQLHEKAKELAWCMNEIAANDDTLHRAILTGLLTHVGLKTNEGDYAGPRGQRFEVARNSALAKRKPQWLMAYELVETHRLYARTVASIDPAWIADLAPHLIKREFSEPFFDDKRQQVVGFEKQSLYGLVIVERKKTSYRRVDPNLCRATFIREALVHRRYRNPPSVLTQNNCVLDEITEQEDRMRRRDLSMTEDALYRFYDERIPDTVCDVKDFAAWWSKINHDKPALLNLSREQAMMTLLDEPITQPYPDHRILNGARLRLSYRFEPGHAADGVTVHIPWPLLAQLEPEPFVWLVQGLMPEKIMALLKQLPKDLRTKCAPLQACAENLVSKLIFQQGSMHQQLADLLQRHYGITVREEMWQEQRLEPHLQMFFRVMDDDGTTIDAGRDLRLLQKNQNPSYAQIKTNADFAERLGLTYWDFGDLPEQTEFIHTGARVQAYPALQEEGAQVALRLFLHPKEAACRMQRGLVRLCFLQLSKDMQYLRKQLPGLSQMALYFTSIGNRDDLLEDCMKAAIAWHIEQASGDIRTKAAFDQLMQILSKRMIATVTEMAKQLTQILTIYHAMKTRLCNEPKVLLESYEDMRAQLHEFIYKGFIYDTGYARLPMLCHYMEALQIRLERLMLDPARDRRLRLEYLPFKTRLQLLERRILQDWQTPATLLELRWMLWAYQAPLFAPTHRALSGVSAKKLTQMFETVEKEVNRA